MVCVSNRDLSSTSEREPTATVMACLVWGVLESIVLSNCDVHIGKIVASYLDGNQLVTNGNWT